MESFGEYLKHLRESRGMSVNQLGMYSGISAATISRIETGKRGTPKPSTIQKLATALKESYEEMMKVAGYLVEDKQEEDHPSDDPTDKLIYYLDVLKLTNEEIKKRMSFHVEEILLTDEEAEEFLTFVRVKRAMKMQQPANASKSERP